MIAPLPEGHSASLAEARAALFQTRAAIIAACRHLTHNGVSVFLVYRLQRMRALRSPLAFFLPTRFARRARALARVEGSGPA